MRPREADPGPGTIQPLDQMVVYAGQLAPWQAERAVGDHDRNTLRVRVEPLATASALEPGMTVWLAR